MDKKDPSWLENAREFCRSAGISIMAWGPRVLVVEAKSAERAREIAAQMEPLGFEAIEDDADRQAGMLSLSKDS